MTISNKPKIVKAIPIAGPFTIAISGLEKQINALIKFLNKMNGLKLKVFS